jgi:hypothetical protein
MAVVAAFRHRIRAAHPLDQRVPAGLRTRRAGPSAPSLPERPVADPWRGGKANAADPKPLRFFRWIFWV